MSPILSSPGHGLLNKMTVQSGSAFFRIEFLPVFKVRQNSQIFMNVTTFQISFPRLLEATWRSKSVVVMETSFICTLPFISLQTNGSFTLPRSVVATGLGFSVEGAGLVVVIYTMLVYCWGKDLHNPGPCCLCSSFMHLICSRGLVMPETLCIPGIRVVHNCSADVSPSQIIQGLFPKAVTTTAMANEFWLLCVRSDLEPWLWAAGWPFSYISGPPPLCLSCLYWCFL